MISTSFPPWYPGLMAAIISPGYLIYFALIFSSSLFGILSYQKLSRAFQILVILLSLVTITEATSRILIILNGSSFPVYHLIVPLQIIFYSLIFRELFLAPWVKRLTLIIGAICLVFNFILSFEKGWDAFPSLNIILLSTFLILCSLYIFYQLVQNPSERNLLEIGEFWFAVGNLMFWAGSFLILGLLEVSLANGIERPPWIFKVLKALNYLLYSCYLLSIYLELRKTESSDELR